MLVVGSVLAVGRLRGIGGDGLLYLGVEKAPALEDENCLIG